LNEANDYQNEIQIIFKQTILVHFEKLLSQLNQKFDSTAYSTHFEDTEYLVMVIIFYCISKFKFNESKNPQWLKLIFKMHNAQSKDYFEFLNKSFGQEDLKDDLISKLDDFLNENKKSYFIEEGFNALKLMYHIKQRGSGETSTKAEHSMSQYGRYTIGKELHNTKILAIYLDFYKMDYKFETKISSLILSFFSNRISDNLPLYFECSDLPLQSLAQYSEMQTTKLESGSEPKFIDEARLRSSFTAINEHIIKTLNSTVKQEDITLKDKQSTCLSLLVCIRSLLKRLISSYSKELDTIVDTMKLYLKIYALLLSDCQKSKQAKRKIEEENSLDDEEIFSSLDNDPIKEITELTQKWFDKECNESILINFGVKKRTKQEIDEHTKKFERN
jgi:hypothetical protein